MVVFIILQTPQRVLSIHLEFLQHLYYFHFHWDGVDVHNDPFLPLVAILHHLVPRVLPYLLD